ncbi:MAG TPA: thioredoxin [Streptosporangiaceae bacterium]|nr:thioredoxin [Streptosporangiaceae bacterium]
MSTIELTKDTFENTVTQDGITLVDWWAEWCGPCRQFAPVFQAASEEHPDVRFGKIDTEDQQELAAAARITSIPTLMAFRDGILVFSQPGALPAPALEQVIKAVQDLDMDDVRAEVAKQQAGDPQDSATQDGATQDSAAQAE